jgi:heme exporter protein D
MGNIGILELIIILAVAITYISVIILAIKKLVKSKLTPNQKL